MKQITLFILFNLILFGFTYAQSSNAQAIEAVEQKMKEAVSQEDYTKAAELQRELKIRKDIKTAVEAGNYEEAARLNRVLEGKEIEEDSPASSTVPENGDVLLYLFPSKAVGSIGGYVNMPDGEKVEIAAGQVKKVKIRAGKTTLTTNKSEKVAEVSRTLKPGHAYFLLFSKKVGAFVARPVLQFADRNMFDSLTNYYEDIDPAYKIYDYKEEAPAATIKLMKRKNFNGGLITMGKAIIYINGEPVIEDFSHKNYYELAVPEGELDIVMNWGMGGSVAGTAAYLLNISSGEQKFIQLETTKKGMIYQYGMKEVTEEEFNELVKRKDKVSVPHSEQL